MSAEGEGKENQKKKNRKDERFTHGTGRDSPSNNSDRK